MNRGTFLMAALAIGNIQFVMSADTSIPRDNLTAEIVQPCTGIDDYVRQGRYARCTCSPINGANNAYWFRNDDKYRHSGSVLTAYYRSSEPNQTFICSGSSVFGDAPYVTYTPKFAYGPSSSSMVISVNGNVPNIDVKFEVTSAFLVYCDFLKPSVNPKPTVRLYFTEENSVEFLGDTDSTEYYYRFMYKVTPKSLGKKLIKCLAFNAIFPGFRSEKQALIDIKESEENDQSDVINNVPIVAGFMSGIAVLLFVIGILIGMKVRTLRCKNKQTNKSGTTSMTQLKQTGNDNYDRLQHAVASNNNNNNPRRQDGITKAGYTDMMTRDNGNTPSKSSGVTPRYVGGPGVGAKPLSNGNINKGFEGSTKEKVYQNMDDDNTEYVIPN